MKKGFTLIELLVVVLIIGILAAVALPQYTKAVEKARTAEAMQMLGDIATAESIYYMAKNEFTGNLNNLDIVMAGVTGDTGTVSTNSYTITITSPAAATGNTSVGQSFAATAERKSGTYEGAKLQITVDANGKIEKSCVDKTTGEGTSAVTKSLKALATTWCK